jgi:2-polyprenyl-6-methoxyphenol hydroxylase-like FAD-dependent oxidoreductase
VNWGNGARCCGRAQFAYVDEQTAELASPERLTSTPQDRIETVLSEAALELDGVRVWRGVEVVGFEQDDTGATLFVRSSRTEQGGCGRPTSSRPSPRSGRTWTGSSRPLPAPRAGGTT